jgi:hypothetical protein
MQYSFPLFSVYVSILRRAAVSHISNTHGINKSTILYELNDLHCSPNIVWVIKSRRMRWAGHVGRVGGGGEMYAGFWWWRPLGRPRRRWEDNINMDLQEVGYEGIDWIDLAQDRDRWRALVNAPISHFSAFSWEIFTYPVI